MQFRSPSYPKVQFPPPLPPPLSSCRSNFVPNFSRTPISFPFLFPPPSSQHLLCMQDKIPFLFLLRSTFRTPPRIKISSSSANLLSTSSSSSSPLVSLPLYLPTQPTNISPINHSPIKRGKRKNLHLPLSLPRSPFPLLLLPLSIAARRRGGRRMGRESTEGKTSSGDEEK